VVGGAILLVTLSALGYDFDTIGRRRADDDAERSSAEERRLVKADDPTATTDGSDVGGPHDDTVDRSAADRN